MTDPRELLEASFSGLPWERRQQVDEYLGGRGDHRFPLTLDDSWTRAIELLPHGVRGDFYRAMAGIDDLTLVRLGRLLAATVGRVWSAPLHVPRSVWALLHDIARSAQGPSRGDVYNAVTIDLIRRLLALEGVMPSALDGMLLDILVGSSRRSASYAARGLQTIPGVAEFAAQHARELVEHAVGYSEGGQLEVVRLASEHPPLAVQLPHLLATYAVSGEKDVRSAALTVLSTLPLDLQVATLEDLLQHAPAASRAKVIVAIERIPDAAQANSLLERALAGEKGARAAELDRALQRLAIYALASSPDAAAVPPLEPLPEHPLDEAAVTAMHAALAAELQKEERALPRLRAERAAFVRDYPGNATGNELEWRENSAAVLRRALDAMPAIAAYLSGTGPHPGNELLDALARVRERLVGFEPVTWARLVARPGANSFQRSLMISPDGATDARALAEVLVRAGCTQPEADGLIVASYFRDLGEPPTLTPAQLVHYAAERPTVFDVVLGLTAGVPPVSYSDLRDHVLAVLEASPSLAARYLPVVTGLAIGTAKAHRGAAQRVLEKHGLAQRIAEEALGGASADARIAAALWIERLGGDWAVEQLSGRLEKERSATARATLLACLERPGRDIRGYLRPEVLEAEAADELRKGLPAALRGYPFDEVPECRYVDGARVPAEVVRWWIVLAHSLKDPLGAGLLPLYTGLLDEASATALGRFVLLTWIARDSAPPDDARVLTRAMTWVAQYSRRVASATGSELALSVDEVFDALERERERLAAAAPSAIGEKGILSLAGRVPGPELAELVHQFLKRQHLKRAQIEALLHVLSLSDDPEPLQLLVSVARRYRTATVQEAARALVDAVAAKRGWSPDELADRMIPTAGLGGDRTLELDFGPRRFVARLGDALTLTLETRDGAPLTALPAPRVDDTEAPSAKAELAAARKELKASVTAQRRRLYDALCLRREWSGSAWLDHLVSHPVMGLLSAALVWHVGDLVVRPDRRGVVRTLGGIGVEVPPDARVTLAHRTTLAAAEVDEWLARPTGIALGLHQFRARPVVVTGTESRRSDLEGRDTESFRLRSRATALEWVHGATGDDVRFDEYVKEFPGLTAAISFSGSSLPETSIPVELGALTVRRAGSPVRFADIPPALLAEIVADYLTMDT